MAKKSKKRLSDRIALGVFIVSVLLIVFGYGIRVGEYRLFPYNIVSLARDGFNELKLQSLRFTGLSERVEEELPWYFFRVEGQYKPSIYYDSVHAFSGLNLVTGVDGQLELFAVVLDMNGDIVHRWNVDWFDVWPDVEHLPSEFVPKSKPGGLIHDQLLLDNGDLLIVYGDLGLVRMDINGNVIWRLPYMTHHSILLDDNDYLWVCGKVLQVEIDPNYPFFNPPYYVDTIIKVDLNGNIVKEWSVYDILQKNGYQSLLTIEGRHTPNFSSDPLHLNNVEPFPKNMVKGYFCAGDILVSLRNINTIFVFSSTNDSIKYISTGVFDKQHDPDFIDGNSFSVYDNGTNFGKSSINVVTMPGDIHTKYYDGRNGSSFYNFWGGKHQWLPNNNLLINIDTKGQAIEIDTNGNIVWRYTNYVSEDVAGALSVERISRHIEKLLPDKRSF